MTLDELALKITEQYAFSPHVPTKEAYPLMCRRNPPDKLTLWDTFSSHGGPESLMISDSKFGNPILHSFFKAEYTRSDLVEQMQIEAIREADREILLALECGFRAAAVNAIKGNGYDYDRQRIDAAIKLLEARMK